jgi:hypothetical protein
VNNTNEFTDKNIIDAINNINKQIKYIKSIYKMNNIDSNLEIQEDDSTLNNIENSIETVVESIEPVSQKSVEQEQEKEHSAYKFVSTVEDNDTLLISEKQGKIFLPYTVNDLEQYLEEYPDEYKSLSDVVNQEYIVSIDKYRHQSISRFREMYYLMRDVEMKSVIESFKRAVEVMFDSRINSTIIAACRTEEQVNNYIYCVERNDLDSFKDFKIVFDMAPMNNINNYQFDYEEPTIKNTRNKRRGKHY